MVIQVVVQVVGRKKRGDVSVVWGNSCRVDGEVVRMNEGEQV